MNNKIIGFTISKTKINHDDVDIFKIGLKIKKIVINNYYFYYWGIGEIDKCLINEKIYSLSFPLTKSLDESNILIRIEKKKIIIENDWLGSIPIFYNLNLKVFSTLINKVIDRNDIMLDPEGFNNYLDFGYSILEQTPLKNIKFLRFNSQIIIGDYIKLYYKRDNNFEKNNNNTEPEEIFNNIKKYITGTERIINDQIIIPTSGGYDSRLMNFLISDKKRIRSFTYGISSNQSESEEVIKAQNITKRLGIKWEQIPLKHFNKYYKDWFFLFGCSTHLHGMYHIEFYKEIRKKINGGSLLSGIIGDVWAGNVTIKKINGYKDILKLGYSHNLTYNSKHSLIRSQKYLYKKFFNENKKALKNPKFRIITSMRFKIILLCYLMKLPDYFGFPSWSPFLNKKIALDMLNLPDKKRVGRNWQIDYFLKNNLYVEKDKLQYDSENVLDETALITPIDNLEIEKKILTKHINNVKKLFYKYNYLINSTKNKKRNTAKILFVKNIKIFKKIKNYINSKKIKVYYDIVILKSIEMTLKLKKYEYSKKNNQILW